MPDPLVPYLIRSGLAGVFAGWVTVILMLGLDLFGLGELVAASDLWPIPLLMLLAFFGITFGSLAMGGAIMSIGREDAAPGRRVAVQRVHAAAGFGLARNAATVETPRASDGSKSPRPDSTDLP